MVSSIRRLEIDDRVVLRTISFRPDFEIRIARLTHLVDDLFSLLGLKFETETDALNSRIVIGQIELVNEPTKLVRLDAVAGGKQSRAGSQQCDVSIQTVLERSAHLPN